MTVLMTLADDKYIEFCLGSEKYALPLLTVREVISTPEMTHIPNVPAYFVGIMNLRGQVITVLDARKKLGIKPNADIKEQAVIIVSAGGFQVGMVVDSINRVVKIDNKDQVTSIPEFSSQINSRFISSVIKKENSLTVILNVMEVLDIKTIQGLKLEKTA